MINEAEKLDSGLGGVFSCSAWEKCGNEERCSHCDCRKGRDNHPRAIPAEYKEVIL